jgi:hypothetical protein
MPKKLSAWAADLEDGFNVAASNPAHVPDGLPHFNPPPLRNRVATDISVSLFPDLGDGSDSSQKRQS